MSTLAEIEAAAAKLPSPQKKALIKTLSAQLQEESAGVSSATDINSFAGIIHLTEDPLEWQRRIREE